jgi:Uncharacterised nucleotidyltransferase
MFKRRSALRNLCRCLRSQAPASTIDWMAVIELANLSAVTPALSSVASSSLEQMPADVRTYLDEILGRNLLRNKYLTGQLFEAVAKLNASGITSTLIKGTALLAASPSATKYRMLCDLDILLSPDEFDLGLKSLAQIGYRFVEESSFGHSVVIERPQDVGQIDLHRMLPSCGRLDAPEVTSKLLVREGLAARVLTPTYQMLLLIYHDQFHDRDYWTARIDLRHLLDLRELMQAGDEIDWEMLDSHCRNNFVRNNIETQLVTLHKLLGVEVPLRFRKRFVPRFQCWRRLQQTHAPELRIVPFLMAFLLDLPSFLRDCGQMKAKQRSQNITQSTWNEPTWRFLVEMLRLVKQDRQRFGKI